MLHAHGGGFVAWQRRGSWTWRVSVLREPTGVSVVWSGLVVWLWELSTLSLHCGSSLAPLAHLCLENRVWSDLYADGMMARESCVDCCVVNVRVC